MNKLFVSIAALIFAVPAIAQTPAWWTALHGASYQAAADPTCPAGFLCTPVVAQAAQIAAPVVAAVEDAVAATSSITYLPKWYGSVGAGGIVPGHGGTFAYESISAYIGAQTYATTAQEYTISKGKVQSCTMAGVSKVLYQFGLASIGGTGLGGGCNSNSGSAGAGAVQGFISFRLRKTDVSIPITFDKTFTTDGRQGVKATFGISYGR